MLFRQSLLFLGLIALVVSCVGCGEAQIRAHGTVQFEDGAPLTVGIVVFSNPQSQYTGMIAQDGSFQLGGIVEGGGLPAGSYSVSIQNAILNDESIIPVRYTSAGTSGINFEVTRETARNPLVITLTRP